MQTKTTQRWGTLQKIVFIVRNFKSIVLSKVLKDEYPSRRPISHTSSYTDIVTTVEDRHCDYVNDCRVPIGNDIGDIVGITSR